LAFIVVFSAGVVCSVICPERPIVPDKGQQEKGPCTDCTSTDFTSGAKVSIEKASLNSAAGLELNWFLAPVSWYASPMIFVSKRYCSSRVLLSLQAIPSFVSSSGSFDQAG